MKTFIIGDVHGCLEELDELCRLAKPDDNLLFLGDLVDRGPDSLGVLRRMREHPTWRCIAGNHEEQAFRSYEKKLFHKLEPWAEKATAEDWEFIKQLPLIARFDRFIAVHGGFFPRFFTLYPEGIGEVPINWQKAGGKKLDRMRRFLRVRNINAEGNMVDLTKITDQDPHWSSGYDGREGFAFFGHDPQLNPPVPLVSPQAMGLDTGCVFGGCLTAAIVEGSKIIDIVSIPAKREYAPPRKLHEE